MTHGSGGISYGGGGGGGGGFSSGATFTTHYYHGHRRRRDGNGNGDDAACCCFLCYLVFFILCLVKMKPRTRIILTWLYCIVGACVTGSLIGLHYSSRDLTASPTDMRKVDQISSLFCESVLVDSSSMINTYKFESEPKINETSSLKYETTRSTELKRNSYEYWGFFLLSGSEVDINVCPDNGMSLYFIRSKKNLDAWIENALCSDCYEDEHFMSYCSSPSLAFKYTFTASFSDQYYFLFANEGYNIIVPGPSSADIHFILHRKLYELNSYLTYCTNEFDCEVPISVSGTESVVFFVPKDRSLDIAITIYCEPRVYMYLILFALLPVTCGTIVTVLVLKVSKRKCQQRSRSESQVFSTSSSERLHGYVNESCQININPPSYSEAPPTYEQAVQNGTK